MASNITTLCEFDPYMMHSVIPAKRNQEETSRSHMDDTRIKDLSIFQLFSSRLSKTIKTENK